MGENIGSLNWDVTVNLDDTARQTAEKLSAEIKKGLETGAAAAKQFEDVIFEIRDSFTQVRDEVKNYYDVSIESFEKLTEAQRYNQSEFLKLSEARGIALSAEQKAWLDMYEQRLQKERELRETANSGASDTGGDPAPRGPRSAKQIIGSDFAGILTEAQNELNSLDQTTQRYYTSTTKVIQRLAEVRAAQKELNTQFTGGKITQTEYRQSVAALVAQEDLLLGTIESLKEGQKAFQNQLTEDAGVIPKLKQQLAELRDQYELLSEEELKGDQGKGLAEKISAIKDQIVSLKPENVGKTTAEAVTALTKLRQLRNELAGPLLKEGSPERQAVLEEATELEKRLKNINKELKLAGSNTAGIDATIQAVRGLVGGFTALQGIIGLVSDGDEELQKTLLTVTSAMSVLQGVQEVAAVIDKESALNVFLRSKMSTGAAVAATEQAAATAGLTAATEAEAIATVGATTATRGFTAALAANPAGALLLALTAVVGIIYAFVSANKDAAEVQKEVNEAEKELLDTMNQLADLYAETYRIRQKDAEQSVSLAQAQGKSELDILELRRKSLQLKKEENIMQLEFLGYSTTSIQQLQNELDLRRQEAIAAQETLHAVENTIKLKKEQGKSVSDDEKEHLDAAKAKAERLNSEYEKGKTLVNGIVDASNQEINIDAEKEKKISDNALKSAVAAAEAKLLLVRKNTKAEYDLELERIEAKRKQARNNANLTADEITEIEANATAGRIEAKRKYDVLLLNNDRSLLQARLTDVEKNSAAELDLRRKLIENQLAIDKKAAGLTPQREKEITAAANKAKEELNRTYLVKLLQDQKSSIEAQLQTVKEGSGAELLMRQQLIERQLDIDLLGYGLSAEKKQELSAKADKAISDLTKQYAQSNSEAAINTKISEISKQLAEVQKGSEIELQLKKDLIDQKAALDSVGAQRSIKNERELAAKLKAIAAQALVDKRKEDDEYSDKRLQEAIRRIDTALNDKNVPLDAVINNPFSTAAEKFHASLDKLKNNLEGLKEKQREALKVIASGKGDLVKAQNDFDNYRNAIHETENQIDSLTKKRLIDFFKNMGDQISKVSSSVSSLASALKGTNDELADTLQTMADIGNIAADAAKGFASFAAGDIVGGISSTVSVITGIFKIGQAARESQIKAQAELAKFQAQLLAGEIETNIQYRERLRLQEQINKTRLQGLKDEGALLVKQRAQSLEEYKRIFGLLQQEQFVSGEHTEQYGGFLGIGRKTRTVQDLASLAGKSFDDLQRLFNSGQLTDKAKELFQTLQKLKQEGADIDQQLADIKQQANELFTGTTADSIADSIIEGFKNGKRGLADFADTFEDLMRQAVFQSLKFQTLEPALKKFYEQFADYTQSGDVLTADEIQKLSKVYNDIITKTNAQFKDLQAITQLNFSGSSGTNSLAGAIKLITADQAQLLAGQFGGLRITAADQLSISKRGLDVLQNIENNTSFIPLSYRILQKFDLQGIKIR